jgi:hypothetical protein
LVVVNAHILHNKSSQKICRWKFSKIKVAKVLLAAEGREIQLQGQTSSPACRLVGQELSVYSIPATHAKLEGKSQLTFLESAEKQAPYRENCEDMH